MKASTITIQLFTLTLSFTAHADIGDGLIVHYPFNGNADDSSGNENHGSVLGALLTDDRFGQSDSAYFFDGIDDYIAATVTALPSGSETRSISLWAKALPDPAKGYALVHWGAQENRQSFGIITNSSPLTWQGMAYGGGNDVNSGVVADTTWHHIVVTYDGALFRIYLDKDLRGTKSISLTTAQSNLTIGSVSSGATMLYNGIIDDVRIYDRVITDDDIHELYCRDLTFEEGLVARYLLSGNGEDFSGNANHATTVNVDFGADRFGNENSAAMFNGVNQYIQFETRAFEFPNDFTFSGWVNFTSGLGIQGPRIYSSPGWEITTTGTGSVRQIQTGVSVVGGGGVGIISAGSFDAGEWHHICVVREGDTEYLYMNGRFEASAVNAGTVNYSAGWYPTLGTNSGALSNDRFGGLVDDVRLYSRGLSQCEVEALYAVESESQLDPLIGGAPVEDLPGWYLSDWFGYYNTDHTPWIFHGQHGFIYRAPSSTNESMFVYDGTMGTWWWTSKSIYPYIYVFTPPADNAGTDIESNWLFYFEETKGPRVFGILTGDHAGSFLFFDS